MSGIPIDPILRQWTGYYYVNSSRRWIHGLLCITGTNVYFEREEPNEKLITIPYDDITDLRKASSTFFFGCLVVSTGKVQHWFSSLPSRTIALNVIEHFWKNRLVISDTGQNESFSSKTKLGQELLKLATDSEKVLQKSGQQLKRQGEQLDYAAAVMYDLNSDLTIAENIMSGLETWLGRWKVPQVLAEEPMELVDARGIPTVYEFPVLYHTPGKQPPAPTVKGTVRISKEGITILDEQQKTAHHYRSKEVSQLSVLSPWEIVVTRFMIGQPDITYSLLCSHTVKMVKALYPLFRGKIQYDDPPGFTKSSTDIEKLNNISPRQTGLLTGAQSTWSSGPPSTSSQIQVQKTDEIVSSEEAEELSSMVARMKAMAVDISQEQELQLQKIDDLTSNVEVTTGRVRAEETRIKQLL